MPRPGPATLTTRASKRKVRNSWAFAGQVDEAIKLMTMPPGCASCSRRAAMTTRPWCSAISGSMKLLRCSLRRSSVPASIVLYQARRPDEEDCRKNGGQATVDAGGGDGEGPRDSRDAASSHACVHRLRKRRGLRQRTEGFPAIINSGTVGRATGRWQCWHSSKERLLRTADFHSITSVAHSASKAKGEENLGLCPRSQEVRGRGFKGQAPLSAERPGNPKAVALDPEVGVVPSAVTRAPRATAVRWCGGDAIIPSAAEMSARLTIATHVKSA